MCFALKFLISIFLIAMYMKLYNTGNWNVQYYIFSQQRS